MLKPMELSWSDVDQRIEALHLQDVRIWGIPRGGSIVAGLARQWGAIVVADPTEAEVIVDDIIDSGVTAVYYAGSHSVPVVALVDKQTEGIGSWVHFPWEEPAEVDAAGSVRRILQYIGEDSRRDGLVESPQRVVRSWDTLYSGYKVTPEDLLKWFDDDTDEMIICKGIQFYSTCEHHLLPFYGKVAIGYLPNGRVIGVSKLARIVNAYARRLQIQERLTRQVGELLLPHVNGVAVHIEAQHLCMLARGVEQQESSMVTNYLTGSFREKPQTRHEFLSSI